MDINTWNYSIYRECYKNSIDELCSLYWVTKLCECVHVHVCEVCVYACIGMSVFECVCVCMCVYMRCVWVCQYVYECICMWGVFECLHVYVCEVLLRVSMHVYAYKVCWVCVCMYLYARSLWVCVHCLHLFNKFVRLGFLLLLCSKIIC